MNERRVGRPQKGAAEVGKQGLIRMARDKMREKRFDIFLRKELAYVCGVTPALITYYFKNTDEIFEEIVAETIEQHYNDLRKITQSDLNAGVKLRAVVMSLTEAFKKDINLFDTFEYAVALGLCRRPDFVEMMQQELKQILHECLCLGMPCVFDRDVFHGAIWGVCRAAAANEDASPPYSGIFQGIADFGLLSGSSVTDRVSLKERPGTTVPKNDHELRQGPAAPH